MVIRKYRMPQYCTAICDNTSCPKMITKEMMERADNKENYIRRTDLSYECADYIPVMTLTEMEVDL